MKHENLNNGTQPCAGRLQSRTMTGQTACVKAGVMSNAFCRVFEFEISTN